MSVPLFNSKCKFWGKMYYYLSLLYYNLLLNNLSEQHLRLNYLYRYWSNELH